MSTATHARTRTPAQVTALVVAAVFLLVGVLGFIPGVTTHYDRLSFAGHDSMAMLLGLFMVSVLHNIVHLLFGVAGIASARTARGAKLFLVVGGAAYKILMPAPKPGPPKAGDTVVLDALTLNLTDGHYLQVAVAIQLVQGKGK